jgi:3-oxoacyl-[acyl-carrier protein] reductase
MRRAEASRRSEQGDNMTQTPTPRASISFDFSGQTVLVTGAGRGVGAEIARLFHRSGARVALTDVDAATVEAAARALDESGETAMGLALDVREKSHFEAARDRVAETWGRTDILVNNAGYAKRTPMLDITPQEFDEIVAINMRSVFLGCQVFSEPMRQAGYGRIINITSLGGQNGGTVASAHYAAAKAGAIMLSKYFAQLLAGTGVTVNAIAPGPISTAKGRLSPEQIAMIEKRVPIGRFSEPSELAAATALLASDQGGFIVGATIDMNGGLFMR